MMTVPVQVDGNLVTWQKWHLRIGFNFKEASITVKLAVRHGPGCFKAHSADAKAVQSSVRPCRIQLRCMAWCRVLYCMMCVMRMPASCDQSCTEHPWSK